MILTFVYYPALARWRRGVHPLDMLLMVASVAIVAYVLLDFDQLAFVRQCPYALAVALHAGRVDAFTALEHPVSAVGSRYIDWVIPGLLGMGIMSTGMWSVGFSIATARNRKLLKRFAATPMVRGYFLASFVGSRFMFLVLETVVLMLFARFAFNVTVQGSLVTFSIVCIVGALTFGGMALLVASRARSASRAGRQWPSFDFTKF